MTARRLSAPELDAILAQRRRDAEAAMRGRAHRALPRCSGACDQGRKDCACTTGHVLDRLPEDYDKPEPLTRGESLRFWLVTSAPAFVGVIGFALLLWACEP